MIVVGSTRRGVAVSSPATTRPGRSTRRGVAGRVLAGDHAAGTLHASPCPVTIAPLGFAGREWPAVTRMGVGFDGRAESPHALDLAVALAGDCDATIKIRSVIGSPVTEGEERLYDPGWLEEAREAAAEELEAALRSRGPQAGVGA